MRVFAALVLLATVVSANYEDVRINEVMFHPSEAQLDGLPEQALEWVEIQNTGSSSVQVGYNWDLVIVGEGTIHCTGTTMLAPAECAVIVMSTTYFEQHYGTGYTIVGSGWHELGNDSQTLILKYNDQIVETLHYYGDWGSDYGDDNSTPDCDGDGASLERADATGDPNDPWNWESSMDEASGYPDEDWPGHDESWGTPCAPNTVEGQALQEATWGAIKATFSERF